MPFGEKLSSFEEPFSKASHVHHALKLQNTYWKNKWIIDHSKDIIGDVTEHISNCFVWDFRLPSKKISYSHYCKWTTDQIPSSIKSL